MKLGGSELNGIVDSEEGYQLRPVTGSNMFLILKQKRLNDEDKCCKLEVNPQTRRQITSVDS